MKTPVAFIIFNRPDTTKRVFEAIREAKPPKLLVIADGPRVDRPGEAENCAAARAIIEGVDWECEVLTNYSDVNLGCGKRVSTGIDWVFDQVEEAIILEDDCLPDPSFFKFCELMLEEYRHDQRIMSISGTNFLGTWKSSIQSYYFSYYGGIWGWASWARAWQYFDYEMKLWEESEVHCLMRDILGSEKEYKNREKVFSETFEGKKNIWGYQWHFARLVQSGLSIVPTVNLISNLGFGEDSTNTRNKDSEVSNLKTQNMKFPLIHPQYMMRDVAADKLYFEKMYNPKILKRIFNKIRQLIEI
ncbi:MAG: glycosyltransferase family 2 protein [Dolichospermum sp. DET50]|nr:glycosyltransferase family 2 protein [Dolichospermum sp. DET66]MBS3032560.1 glycosyltransferase family 2 protein [Dolichospermum sp. DET67]MBS3037766.1 glycosyltransferase family 2 protein [Dolichospermum sp. DET50]QSX69707.1 MAG: glycosyltransferase family 2 protein [Dolichospermum sp. DET69]